MRMHIDQSSVRDMVSMDLSKTYDCLAYDLLLAKVEAYGFSIDGLKSENRYFRWCMTEK